MLELNRNNKIQLCRQGTSIKLVTCPMNHKKVINTASLREMRMAGAATGRRQRYHKKYCINGQNRCNMLYIVMYEM